MDVKPYRRPRGLPIIACTLASLLLAAGGLAQPRASVSGVLRLLTYNVAGLPEGISRSRPSANIPRMGPLLSGYDLVLVQEDFAFQAELRAGIRLAHASIGSGTGRLPDLGDGLNRFASHPFRGFHRERWQRCNGILDSGSDCMAPKGFTVATHELAPGIRVDVYNLHMDAGRSADDRRAREAQVEQVLRSLDRRSSRRAVVVAGDTNLWRGDEPVLQRFVREGQLTCACRALRCGEEGRIDRVLFRSGPDVDLTVRRWRVPADFVDDAGRPLSDHSPVEVELVWSAR